MDRKLFGLFSGRQLTVITVAALFAPGALLGAAAFSNVVIQDSVSGIRAAVDEEHRLQVREPNLSPRTFVNVLFFTSGPCTLAYNVPDTQALVVTEVTYILQPNTTDLSPVAALYFGKDCKSGTISGVATRGAGTSTAVDPLASGAAVPAGSKISVAASNVNIVQGFMRGYLVPRKEVPAAGSAEAAMLSGPAQTPLMLGHR